MILRHAPIFAFMQVHYTDAETGAPLFNDRGDLADDKDVDRFENRPEVVREWDRITLEICAEDRRMGVKLPAWLLQAEMAAFIRQREREVV